MRRPGTANDVIPLRIKAVFEGMEIIDDAPSTRVEDYGNEALPVLP